MPWLQKHFLLRLTFFGTVRCYRAVSCTRDKAVRASAETMMYGVFQHNIINVFVPRTDSLGEMDGRTPLPVIPSRAPKGQRRSGLGSQAPDRRSTSRSGGGGWVSCDCRSCQSHPRT